jgi:hypothetical protein
LDDLLAAMWKNVIQAPTDQNPFGDGGLAFACIDLGRIVAPFGPPPGVKRCTMKTGSALFVIGSSYECSSFEGNGTTDTELRRCARDHDARSAPTVTVDGVAVNLTEVETPLVSVIAPVDTIFTGVEPGTRGTFVAHGWVVLLHPLTPREHKVTIEDGDPDTPLIRTSIIVRPGQAT